MTDEEIALAFSFPEGVDAFERSEHARSGSMSGMSPFDETHDAERKHSTQRLRSGTMGKEEDRVFGALLGLAIGDALGAPLEFSPVRYDSTELTGFDAALWKKEHYNRFGLKPGQWTDDTSMALCLADSLLARGGFDGRDLRLRFLNWWYFGYCNAFGFDAERPVKHSVGLGGNIWQSFQEFVKDKTEFTTAGDLQTSGNGSLMRNAPVAVFYRDDLALAEAMSYKQSKTTHQGEEAAECCRLLTRCIVHGIRGDGTPRFLDRLNDGFDSKTYSVGCLARSEQEASHEDKAGARLNDRNWNWRSRYFRYSPTRAREHPDYIGSYSMDALSMALHCVWSTASFPAAVLRCANLCGDSDTTAAITGQIAGAIYGAKAIPAEWIEAVLRWDPRSDILLRALKLYLREELR
jgi:ADP-ribosyl-[dinitrogen reductase] hydrolase